MDSSTDGRQTPAASSSGVDTPALGVMSAGMSRAASTVAGGEDDDGLDQRSDQGSAANASEDEYGVSKASQDEDEDMADDRSVGTSARAADEDDDERDLDEDEDDDDADEDEDEDDEPRSVDEDDLDPINSGAHTPSLAKSASSQQQPTSLLASATSSSAQHQVSHAPLPSTSTATLQHAALTSAAPKPSKALNFHKKRDTITIKGKTFSVQDDEIVLEDDPRGETKIDSNGQLMGGREWKLRTFTSAWRKNPDKLYILSIDVARAAGFRDSLYFFRKFPQVHKVTVGPQEKEGLISQGKLPTMLRSRAVTFVAARNVYKAMGAIFVKDGKYVFDDYYEDKALAAGHQPGEPAVVKPYDQGQTDAAKLVTFAEGAGAAAPNKHGLPNAGRQDEYVPGSAASLWPSVGVLPFSKAWDPVAKKARPPPHLTEENWMLEYAKSAQDYNKYLGSLKRFHQGPVYLNVGTFDDDGDDEEGDLAGGDNDNEPEAATKLKTEPTMDADLAADETRVKRRRLGASSVKGFYDPFTNVAQVSELLQSTRAECVKMDRFPQLGNAPATANLTDGEHNSAQRHRLERAACQTGLATLEVMVERPRADRPPAVPPGIWDFGAGDEWQTRFA
ncbi:hypothetical protein ACM66B_000197 [Microbotryomycetes sp. NB124-2]